MLLLRKRALFVFGRYPCKEVLTCSGMASLRDVLAYSVPESKSNKYPNDKLYHGPNSPLRDAEIWIVRPAEGVLKLYFS